MNLSAVSAQSLAALFVADEDFKRLSQRLEAFCPFEALSVARLEIRHSNFLADILNPYGNHGFGDTFLRRFLDTLLTAEGADADRLNLHLAEFTRIEIRREWRNIDLLILLDTAERNYAVVVEIKVEAAEHSGQLGRYELIASQEYPDRVTHCFFLTPDGAEASASSWTPLSFGTLLDGLEPGVPEMGGDPAARMMVAAYFAMLRRRYVADEQLEEIARRLWQRHGTALDFLLDLRPSPIREASALVRSPERFGRIAAAVMQKTGLEIEMDRCSNTYLKIAFPGWDKLPDMLGSTWTDSGRILLCEVEFYGSKIRARMQLGPGDSTARERVFQRLKDAGDVDVGRKALPTPKFSRLATKTIAAGAQVDEAESSDALAELAAQGIVAFLSEHLPAYDKALRG